jgi:hypothetical protein
MESCFVSTCVTYWRRNEGDEVERWREELQEKQSRDQQTIFVQSDGRGDSLTRRRGQRTYCMPDAKQCARSASRAALAGITHQPAYTHKPDKGGNMKEKAPWHSPKLSTCSAPSASATALSRFCLINDMRDACPALTFTRRLRSVLCEVF